MNQAKVYVAQVHHPTVKSGRWIVPVTRQGGGLLLFDRIGAKICTIRGRTRPRREKQEEECAVGPKGKPTRWYCRVGARPAVRSDDFENNRKPRIELTWAKAAATFCWRARQAGASAGLSPGSEAAR